MTQGPAFQGEVVLVTGGTRGIGLAIARAFESLGAEVHVTGTAAGPDAYDAILSGLHYHPLDLSDGAAVSALPAQLSRLDVLVANAGGAMPGGPEASPEGFAKSVEVNLVAAYRLATAARVLLAASPRQGGGAIVFVSSMSAFFGLPMVPGYAAAKAGLVELTQSLAVGWGRDGIRVNAVAPGIVRTRMSAPMLGQPAAARAMLERIPLGRFGEPADVAGPVVFLAGGDARYVTGQTLRVDGGYTAS